MVKIMTRPFPLKSLTVNNPSNAKCPKCGNPYLRAHHYNCNYTIYVHKQEENSKGLKGLIKYCIVAIDHVYQWPEVVTLINKLNPDYRKLIPAE